MQNLFAQLFPNSTILCSFHALSSDVQYIAAQARKRQCRKDYIIRANYFFAYIKCQTTEFTMRKYQYSASVCAKSLFLIVPKLDYVIQCSMIFPMKNRKLGHKLTQWRSWAHLTSRARRPAQARRVRGHAPPGKFWFSKSGMGIPCDFRVKFMQREQQKNVW
jgi:hypothetical protein